MKRLNAGGGLNYGAQLKSGNFVHLEIWRDPMGFRYQFDWLKKPCPSDLAQLAIFKAAASQDVAKQLGMGIKSIQFPDDHSDNVELSVAS